jgi:transaldolase
MADNPLLQIQALGQSPWCDSVSRSLIAGDLTTWIRAGEITGLTSNPTIFEKAINESTDYDDTFETLVRAGKNADEIFEALALEDIRTVADLLRPVYERTARRDGYASFEVNPNLAHDTQSSLSEARRLFALLDRPNVMIKIPGTPEGIPAFEQAIAEGININVTLLFAIESYERVADAYIRGLERRLADGKPVDHIASVASFFVSRVDTAVDKALEAKFQAGASELIQLQGKAAIANARLAYKRFKQIFSGPRFQSLADRGAMVQRPLWASTSTKNPAYRDVMYVEQLIGPDTVDTMPPATIEAFREHGQAELTLEQDGAGAEEVFDRLAAAGLDMEAITLRLQVDGVRLFSESFDTLIESSERKRQTLLAGRVEQTASR